MSNTFYIEPKLIARKYNINVIEDTPFNPVLQADESGMIEKRDDGSVVIYYKITDHPNRQRFTIAHELGHFFLGHLDGHKKMFRDTTKNYSLSTYDIYEQEANDYAARLLMPDDKISFLIETESIYDIQTLAKIFKVSEVAMTYRLKNLGWIK